MVVPASVPVDALTDRLTVGSSAMVRVALGGLFSSTETVLAPESEFATAKSVLPSPFKSPAATEKGRDPTVILVLPEKPPKPFPKRMETLLEP